MNDDFISQLQELTKNSRKQQEKEKQLKQQKQREKATQDVNKFFDNYFSKWLIELANQGLFYMICRIQFEPRNRLDRIIFHKDTRPDSRKELGIVIFSACSPYYDFCMEDFINLITNNHNFSQVLYEPVYGFPSTYYCLINWGTELYALNKNTKTEEESGKMIFTNEHEHSPLPRSKFLQDIDNLCNSDYNKKTEREKMTAGLRYNILKRDGYKCKICGRGVEDGVKLHVDHIVPIVKGGKTVPENLQTLCQDCNLGKGTKDF